MIDVCHVITDSNLGGAGRWVQTLCRYLPRNRFRITVIFPQGSRLEEILKGERVCLCPAPVTADSSFCKKDLATYCRLFAQLRPALVHTHGCATARLAAKLKGIPVVFTKHTVGNPMTGMNRWLNKKLCTKAIAVSDYAKESLERDGISPEKVELIYNACPDRGKNADREKAREEFQIPEGKLAVGMFARLSEEKGWQAMSRAICLAKEKRLPLFFLLAGGGRMEETLRQQLEGCPARMLGELADIGPALHACDAVCVPSLEESFGLTALEAMSASLPVVATRVGGLGEVLGEADELTVKPGDAESLLKALENLQDDPLRRKLGARGRKRYEKLFGPENFAMRVENLYREILDHKKKGGEK